MGTPGHARQGAEGCSLPPWPVPQTRLTSTEQTGPRQGCEGRTPHGALYPRGAVPTAGVMELHVSCATFWGTLV